MRKQPAHWKEEKREGDASAHLPDRTTIQRKIKKDVAVVDRGSMPRSTRKVSWKLTSVTGTVKEYSDIKFKVGQCGPEVQGFAGDWSKSNFRTGTLPGAGVTWEG